MALYLDLINGLLAFSILVIGILIVLRIEIAQVKWSLLFFGVCVLLYLTLDYVDLMWLKFIFITGPFLGAFAFWVLARSMFAPRPVQFQTLLLLGVATLVVYHTLFYLGQTYMLPKSIMFTISWLISVGFIGLALFESRRNQRKVPIILVFVAIILIVITFLTEIAFTDTLSDIMQRATLLIFSIYLIMNNKKWEKIFYVE